MTKPQPKDTQGDKGWYENNVQLVQWISSVYKSANDRTIETCLVQWISSEIKLRKSHLLGQPKQQVDVTQADDGDIQREKSKTHHQWDHQYIHVGGATLDNKWTDNPSIFGHGFPKTKARILGFGDVGVRNMELVTEFTSNQTEMINETVIEAITGAIMAMIAELTGDWIGDWIGNQSEMISELVSELIPKLIGDPDGRPLTVVVILDSEVCQEVVQLI